MNTFKSLNPCSYDESKNLKTLRAVYEVASASDIVWALGKAHIKGTLNRQRLVLAAVICAESIPNMPEASTAVLKDLRRWINVESVDLKDARVAAAAAASAAAAVADALKKEFSLEEICKALHLDPDEVFV